MSSLTERGGVSIFIVVFTALMVTVVTTSFAQIMLKTQQQATNSDLSQSAYDAAMAGVEDAKRVLVRLRECENTTGCDSSAIRNQLETKECESLDGLGVKYNDEGEVQVGEASMNQAYTCVVVNLETDGYKGETPAGKPTVIPLQSKGAPTQVTIYWFSREDFKKIKDNREITDTEPTFNSFPQLPTSGDWGAVTPALMRVQLIQFNKGNINLDQFSAAGTNNARTLFLYPQTVGATSTSFNLDARREPNTSRNSPVAANCSTAFDYRDYACKIVIDLPDPEGGTPATREAYIQLQTFYQDVTTYEVRMDDDNDESTPVKFDTVQPEVDSTGRASELFRRVKANISLRNKGIPYQWPDAALTVEGNLCKQFFVTDNPTEFLNAPAITNGETGDTCEP